MKKIFIIILISFTGLSSYSQEKELPVLYQKDLALPIDIIPTDKLKVVDLSKQNKPIKKVKSKTKKYNKTYKKPSASTLSKEQKLEAKLTPEQKEKIKNAKENKPRRGVTTMPNERTAK
jgi:hypothetical protein